MHVDHAESTARLFAGKRDRVSVADQADVQQALVRVGSRKRKQAGSIVSWDWRVLRSFLWHLFSFGLARLGYPRLMCLTRALKHMKHNKI
jgi:hypothetical protein